MEQVPNCGATNIRCYFITFGVCVYLGQCLLSGVDSVYFLLSRFQHAHSPIKWPYLSSRVLTSRVKWTSGEEVQTYCSFISIPQYVFMPSCLGRETTLLLRRCFHHLFVHVRRGFHLLYELSFRGQSLCDTDCERVKITLDLAPCHQHVPQRWMC